MCDHGSDQTIGPILTVFCTQTLRRKILIEFVNSPNCLDHSKLLNIERSISLERLINIESQSHHNTLVKTITF